MDPISLLVLVGAAGAVGWFAFGGEPKAPTMPKSAPAPSPPATHAAGPSLPAGSARPKASPPEVKIGEHVEAQWTDGKWYGATVQKIDGAAVTVAWDDGTAPSVAPVRRAPERQGTTTVERVSGKSEGQFVTAPDRPTSLVAEAQKHGPLAACLAKGGDKVDERGRCFKSGIFSDDEIAGVDDVGGAKPDADKGHANALSALSALADPGLKADLSEPGKALASALDQGLGIAVGLGKSLSEAGANAVASLAGNLASTLGTSVAEIMSSTIESVPILGQIFSAGMALYDAFGTVRSPAEHCQEFLTAYAVKPSGSMLGSRVVPADYFVRNHSAKRKSATGDPSPWPSTGIVPSDGRFRSALGMALMQATEGAIIDDRDLSAADWKTGDLPSWNPGVGPYAGMVQKLAPKQYARAQRRHKADLAAARRSAWIAFVDDNYDRQATEWHNGKAFSARGIAGTVKVDPKNDAHRKKRGLPRAWRRRFRALRRGIEASYRHGDGGAALWLLYSDLLASAFRRGYLSVPFLTHMLAAGPGHYDPGMGPTYWCAPTLARAIGDIADGWQRTIRPSYQSGKGKLAAIGKKNPSLPAGPAHAPPPAPSLPAGPAGSRKEA